MKGWKPSLRPVLSQKHTNSARRSLLFVPATTPERFDKAVRSGADIICLELEDAVPPDAKATARAAAFSWLSQASRLADYGTELAVRINRLSSDEGAADLDLMLSQSLPLDLMVIPKVEDADSLARLSERLDKAGSDIQLIIMIESVQGLYNLPQTACATSRVTALMFGGVDLAGELRSALSWEPLLHARSQLVQAGRYAKLNILDMPSLVVDPEDEVMSESLAAQALGFDGKACIHPRQLAAVHQAFTPDDAAVAEAEQIVAAYEKAGGGVALHKGRLVELPVMMQARLCLERRALADRKQRLST